MADQMEERHDRMQRIRVGLTGLAVILLLVLLATAIFSQVNKQAGGNVAAPKQGDEPLTQLGVVPPSPENGVAPANVETSGQPLKGAPQP